MPYTFTVITNTTGATFAAPGFNSHTFFSAGAGTVAVSVIDHNGCSGQMTINISEPALLDPGRIVADQVICFGSDPVRLDESITTGRRSGCLQFQWQYSANAAGPFMNIAMATSNYLHTVLL